MAEGLTTSGNQEAYSLIGNQMKQGAMLQGLGSFGQMMGEQVKYDLLRRENAQLGIEASNIELQAQQKANMLREQFIESVGSYQYGAARRGVSVNSANVTQNIENSAVSLGRDIQKQTKIAELKADALRTRRKLSDNNARFSRNMGMLNSISNMALAGMNYNMGTQLQNMGSSK